MSEDVFDAGWLALREPVDHRSRAHELLDRLLEATAPSRLGRVVDLGGGTGSNLRYLAPRLPAVTRWTVVDHDPVLLSGIQAPGGIPVRTVAGDLREEGLEEAAGADLVTASALLDLVTRPWLSALARHCAARDTPLLLALSYDGTIRWREREREPEHGREPEREDDRFVTEAVNRHQAGPKGMGTALGPEAWRVAGQVLEEAGYRVRTAASPWILSGPHDAPLVEALVEGWVEAAVEVHPDQALQIRRWGAGRVADFRGGRVSLEVGHRDLLALPAGPDGEGGP